MNILQFSFVIAFQGCPSVRRPKQGSVTHSSLREDDCVQQEIQIENLVRGHRFFKITNENFRSHVVIGDSMIGDADCIVQFYKVNSATYDGKKIRQVTLSLDPNNVGTFAWQLDQGSGRF